MSHQIHSVCTIASILRAFVLLFLLQTATSAGRIELVLTATKGAPITAMQEWTRALGEAGAGSVRVRHQANPPSPTIQTQNVSGQKTYTVLGTIEANGQITLPGDRFEPGEAKRLAEWLDDIAKLGPPGEREPIDRFGLPESVSKQVATDLGIPLTFGTDGSSRAAILLQIDQATRFPVLVSKEILATLDKDPLTEDLKGLASGTVLAYLIEPFGLGLFPDKDKDDRIVYQIAERSSRDVEPWPIGLKPENRLKSLPELFKTRNINIDRIPIAKVLDAISKRLEVPVLIDRAALARQRIDLDTTPVSLPDARTNFDRALGSMTSQAKLKYELRIDDAGRPFFWITSRTIN